MSLDAPGLCNAWVRLDPLTAEDLAMTQEGDARESVWKWMPALPGHGSSFRAHYEYVLGEYHAARMVPFIVRSPDGETFIGGSTFVSPNKVHRRVGVDYIWLAPRFRGGPYYFAMQALMIQRALDWRAKRIEWRIDTRNTQGIAAVAKLGATFEGTERAGQRMANGDWADMAIYSMIGSELSQNLRKIEAVLMEMN